MYTSLGLPIISYNQTPTMPSPSTAVVTPSGFQTPAPAPTLAPSLAPSPFLTSAGTTTVTEHGGPGAGYVLPSQTNYVAPTAPEGTITGTIIGIINWMMANPIIVAGVGVGAYFLFFRRRAA